MNPYIFEYKSLAISWFIVLSILSIGLGYIFSKKELIGILSKEKIDNLTLKLIIGGFIGARIYYALANWQFYVDNYLSIFHISHLTLNFKGALILASGILYLTSRREDISFEKLLAIYIQAITLGLIIGVWSHYFDNLLTYLESLTFSILFVLVMFLEIIIKDRMKSYKVISGVFFLVYLLLEFYYGV
ncbi:prolipoprotein diacylglyceryltransferase [Halobacteroides halobius DSM 5150]|uniref:Prolipoprotein diacylglyceryltransferase n=1 Tax=Halobacteroides halobius (strain ATCC 35273 / DSM 5150 / MD-1) TaxID=748449 RepID=L0KBG4_HALHC|nr:prolipoprotein diacylglyceryl transferase family protein [Halobacteroides halobius]AGB41875.1 prolipoprotein diacylglyceryltransferase [Halobacteroides halobius DSM 5150]